MNKLPVAVLLFIAVIGLVMILPGSNQGSTTDVTPSFKTDTLNQVSTLGGKKDEPRKSKTEYILSKSRIYDINDRDTRIYDVPENIKIHFIMTTVGMKYIEFNDGRTLKYTPKFLLDTQYNENIAVLISELNEEEKQILYDEFLKSENKSDYVSIQWKQKGTKDEYLMLSLDNHDMYLGVETNLTDEQQDSILEVLHKQLTESTGWDG